jgi:hypothetical protein
MDNLGTPIVSTENLLNYSPSNWSQWSTWFLDFSQFQFGQLTVVLRSQKWVDPRVEVEKYYSTNLGGPATSLGSDTVPSIMRELDVDDPGEEKDMLPVSKVAFAPQSTTLASILGPYPINDIDLLRKLREHAHRLAMERIERMRTDLPRYWQLMLSTLSDHSRKLVEADASYAILQSNHDILGLWKLIAHIHTRGKGGSILQIRNAEKKFLELELGSLGFPEFSQRFNQYLKEARSMGSKFPESHVVLQYLEALKESPLQRRVLDLLDDTDHPNFPRSFETQEMMHRTYLTEVDRGVVQLGRGERNVSVVSVSSTHCTYCAKKGHEWSSCYTLRQAIESGQLPHP